MGGHIVAVLALTEPWVHVADGSSLVLGVPHLYHPRRSDRKPLWSTVVSPPAHFSPTHTHTHTVKSSPCLNSLQEHKSNIFSRSSIQLYHLSPQTSEKLAEGNKIEQSE